MNKNLKRMIVSTLLLGSWFLIADAYWVAKDREESKCQFENATELLKHGRITEIFEGKTIFFQQCSWVMGAGNYWDSPRGMAYWEIILLVPVIYRFRFDL